MKVLVLIAVAVLLLVQPVLAVEEQAELECALHMSRVREIAYERYTKNVLNKIEEGDKDAGMARVFDILDRENGLIEALTSRFGACFAGKYITALVAEIRIRIF